MHIRVAGGTPKLSGQNLCKTCRNAMNVEGVQQSQQMTICHAVGDGARINFAVTRCSSYAQKTSQSLHEMKEMAWLLRTDKKQDFVGFIPPKELKREERDEIRFL